MANMRHDFVNTAAIDRTISSIKHGRFKMADWSQCICGHAVNAHGVECSDLVPMPSVGTRLLGVSRSQAHELFGTNLDATKAEAIKVLEILRDEGKVDWRRARGPRTLDGMIAAFDDILALARCR